MNSADPSVVENSPSNTASTHRTASPSTPSTTRPLTAASSPLIPTYGWCAPLRSASNSLTRPLTSTSRPMKGSRWPCRRRPPAPSLNTWRGIGSSTAIRDKPSSPSAAFRPPGRSAEMPKGQKAMGLWPAKRPLGHGPVARRAGAWRSCSSRVQQAGPKPGCLAPLRSRCIRRRPSR